MIEIRRQTEPPTEPGDYVVCLHGPLLVMARWTGEYWLRGATKIHGGVYGYAGPVIVKRGKE